MTGTNKLDGCNLKIRNGTGGVSTGSAIIDATEGAGGMYIDVSDCFNIRRPDFTDILYVDADGSGEVHVGRTRANDIWREKLNIQGGLVISSGFKRWNLSIPREDATDAQKNDNSNYRFEPAGLVIKGEM